MQEELNERAARKARMNTASPKREHLTECPKKKAEPKPLPRVCPNCGSTVEPCIDKYISEVSGDILRAYVCSGCFRAVEIFQDTEKGRVKYVEVKDAEP